MPTVYSIRGKRLPFVPPNPRGAFAVSMEEVEEAAKRAEHEGRLEDAALLDAEMAKFRWMRFRSKQMRLLVFEVTCRDFAREGVR